MAFDKAEFLAKLEEWGEAKTRELLATRAIADPKKVALAEGFLHRAAHERADELDRRKEASNREQIRIARSAKNAAWAAAVTAIIAAIVTVIVSAVTVIVNWPAISRAFSWG